MTRTNTALALFILAGQATADTLHVPADYGTIQEAIDAAVDGDVILVAAMKAPYTGDGNRDLDFMGKAITLEGNVADPSLCVIDIGATEGDPHRALWFHSGEDDDSVVRGFTIRNGFMDRGGAVLIQNSSSPLFEACVFESNVALRDSLEDGGGAIHAHVGGVNLQGCSFLGNHSDDAFGQFDGYAGGGAILSIDSTLNLDDCAFEDNMVTSELFAWGGAVSDIGGTVTMDDCHFSGNTCVEAGAFASLFSTVTQTNCVYTGNSSNFAGAVWDASSLATYEGCTFDDNHTIQAPGDNSAGAYVTDAGSFVQMTGCTISNNSSPGAGGAIVVHEATLELIDCDLTFNTANQAGAVKANNFANVTMERCNLMYNTANLGGGACIYNINTTGTFIGCTFSGNTATEGGAMKIRNNTEVSFINTLFVNNEATGAVAGALFVAKGGGPDAYITVVNSTFTGNQASSGGAVVAETGGHATIVNSILWGDSPNEISKAFLGEVIVSYSDVQGGWEGDGNVDCDPLFVDPDNGDYHILATCVTDAGDNCAVPEGVETDLDANARFVDYPGAANVGLPCEGDTGIVDMGPYERQCTADCNGDAALNILDFVCYQGKFQAGDPAADCDGNGMLNILDFVCFQGLFQAGCP